MDIAAGRDVTITGSDVLSRDGIGIIGQNVTIQAAEDSTSVTETQKFKQTGINVSLKGGAVDTALAVKNSVERAGEAKDDRLSALHAAKAGQTLFSSGGAGLSSLKGMGDQIGQAKADVANEKQTAGGLSLRVGIGASKSSSSTEYTATTSSGSRIASEGDVVIQATGDGQGNGGDLKIIGSKVEGDNVALAAANDLILKSQQETRQQIERNKSSSGEIGITIGSEAGFGVYVAASAAKGKGDGSGTTHAETTIDAANTLTMISGRDMTLEGAQAKGNTVIANVGRDLTMISQQDSNDYKRKDVSAGIDVAVGTGGASVSANYNQSKIDSTYTSVKEQTGIQAGEGGFDINVGGHTQLTGAAIASTADPSRNHLSTGSLSVEDLKNEAAYKASSVGISVSGSTSGGMNAPAPSVGIPQSEKASSVTRGDIAAGTVEVRNGDTTALDGLSRDTNALQQDGLKEIFDQQKVQERLEMGQVAGEVGFTAANDLISWRQDVAAEELRAARAEAGAAAESNDPEAISAAKQRLQIAQAEYGKWDEGGAMKRGTQVATGMLVAVVGGGDIGAAAMGVMANEVLLGKVSSFLNQKGIDSGTAGHDLAIALTGVAGSTVGGAIIGDAMSGVSAGTTAHNYGYYGYRDGGIKAERELNGILDEFAAANPDVSAEDLDGLKATLMGTLKLGATTGDLLAIASTPGYLAEMTVASAVQALAIARFGKDFDALDEQQRRSVAEDFMRFGQVGVMENLSHDGNSAPIEQVDQEPAGREPDWQTKVGTAFSDLIVSGQRGTEKAVNWLGEDNATAAAMAVMVALGGPVKTGLGMAFSASPAGQAIEGVKEQVKDWLTPINGTYLFGANTAAAQNTVLPASGAVAGTTVELGSSLLGASMAASIKGIIGISKGFGSKVDAADSARNEPRDVLGGPHSETTRPSGDGLDSHHCLAKACYADAPLSSEKGPAIKMDPADHRRTTSYGSGDDAIAYRAAQRKLLEQGRLREAIQMDIDDIRMKFGGKYNDGIKQMLEYAETLDSKDFIPKAGGK